ncbi:tumor necrosis factor alpha-induced protein 2 [Hoplias malabaricus]|uniref:tumor necrosis factor alpha-induced protein 2 n=1 Tax=Hoplias malabaricus TaxID=27720 RepID=UPI003461B95B
MPVLKKLPGRSKCNHDNSETVLKTNQGSGEMVLRSNQGNGEMVLKNNHGNDEMMLKSNHSNGELILPPSSLNPFEDGDGDTMMSLRDGEALENEVNAELHGGSKVSERSRGGLPLRGTLERICSSSTVKTLGKLSKGLRITGRNLRSSTLPATPTSAKEKEKDKKKKKNHRRASEEIMTLLRLAGRRKNSERRESLPVGDLNGDEDDEDAHRRPSFLRSLSKLCGDSLTNRNSQDAERESPEEEPPVKRREPLSVLEILQLVNQRDLLLADTHIQELERECALDPTLFTQTPPTATTPTAMTPPIISTPIRLPLMAGLCEEEAPSPWDASLRKVKDVELLYEALQREMWDVVRESLRQPCAGPQLGLVVLVIQQEEHTDHLWKLRQEAQSELREGDQSDMHEGDQSDLCEGAQSDLHEAARLSKRPRKLRQKWTEAVGEAADWSLPQPGGVPAGQLGVFLERLRGRVVEDMDAVRRNVVAVYPTDFSVLQVYLQSYHKAVARRLKSITSGPVQITDIYSLLDWIYNSYNRDVLATIRAMGSIDCATLEPLLPAEVIDRLEQECLNTVWDKLTTELSQVLEDEEKRWAQTLQIEEYQTGLARSIIQRLKVDLDRSTSVSQLLGARVARCTLSGLADFLHSFQRKVEMFHETQLEFGDRGDGYVSRTIALVNCVPPFRSFVERCRQCDPLGSEDSSQRAHSSLERIINQSVRVLTDRLFESIRPFFDKLLRKKWLNNTEAYESIEASIKQHFKKFRRMDCPPYQTLVNEVHRRVMVEYVRAIMRGRVICTSLKMRKRLAYRLQDEAKQLKALFKDLESTCSWLDNVIGHLADIILLEDTPSIQMEVGVLVKEFPDIRRKHVSAVLNVRGMVQQAERQEILAVVRDFENSSDMPRDHALFSEIAVATDMPCLGLVLIRFALTVSSWVSSVRPNRRNRYRNSNHMEDEVNQHVIQVSQ